MLLRSADGVEFEVFDDGKISRLLNHLQQPWSWVADAETCVELPFPSRIVAYAVQRIQGHHVLIPYEDMGSTIALSLYAQMDSWTAHLMKQACFCPVKYLVKLPAAFLRKCTSRARLIRSTASGDVPLHKLLGERGDVVLHHLLEDAEWVYYIDWKLTSEQWGSIGELIKSVRCSSCLCTTSIRDCLDPKYMLCPSCVMADELQCITMSNALKNYSVSKRRLERLPSTTIRHPLDSLLPRPPEKEKVWMKLYREQDVAELEDVMRREQAAKSDSMRPEQAAVHSSQPKRLRDSEEGEFPVVNWRQKKQQAPLKRRRSECEPSPNLRSSFCVRAATVALQTATLAELDVFAQQNPVYSQKSQQARAIQNNLLWKAVVQQTEIEPFNEHIGYLVKRFLYGNTDQSIGVVAKILKIARSRMRAIRQYVGNSVPPESISLFIVGAMTLRETLCDIRPVRVQEVRKLSPPYIFGHRKQYISFRLSDEDFRSQEEEFQATYRSLHWYVRECGRKKLQICWKEVTVPFNQYIMDRYESIFGLPPIPGIRDWEKCAQETRKQWQAIHSLPYWEKAVLVKIVARCVNSNESFDEERARKIGRVYELFSVYPNSLDLARDLAGLYGCLCILTRDATTEEILDAAEGAESADQVKHRLSVRCACNKHFTEKIKDMIFIAAVRNEWSAERTRHAVSSCIPPKLGYSVDQLIAYAQLTDSSRQDCLQQAYGVSTADVDHEFEMMQHPNRTYLVAYERAAAKKHQMLLDSV